MLSGGRRMGRRNDRDRLKLEVGCGRRRGYEGVEEEDGGSYSAGTFLNQSLTRILRSCFCKRRSTTKVA